MKNQFIHQNAILSKLYFIPRASVVTLFAAIVTFGFQLPGSLDPSFGQGGKVTTPVLGIDVAKAVAVQPDGRIVTAGYAIPKIAGGRAELALVRYNRDGSLDATFGGDGKVTAPVAGTHSRAFAVAIQADGKIVAAGDIGAPAGVMRFNPDGTLDTTFDGDGMVTVSFYNNDLAFGVAIQPDGKIVIVGYGESPFFSPKDPFSLIDPRVPGRLAPQNHTTDFAVARLNPDGSLDNGFGNGGKVITGLSLGDIAHALVIQPDGKIVAAGETFDFENNCFALVRYNSNGTLDNSFGGNGVAVTCSDYVSAATSVALQPDGKLVAAGIGITAKSAGDFALARYKQNGLLDDTFSGDGKLTTDINGDLDSASAVAVDNAGRITAGGVAKNPATLDDDLALARFTTDGSPDVLFGSGGKVTTEFFQYDDDAAFGMAIQPDGRIVAAGSTCGLICSFAVARYVGGGGNHRARADFDGDGKTDLSVFRQADGIWYLLRTTAGYTAMAYGLPGDRIAPADFDGDGKTDIAVFRPSENRWYVAGSLAGFYNINWGIEGDIPVPADYDGDGKDDVAIYRPSTGTWYIIGTTDGFITTQFGTLEDRPLPADYDGDGGADLVVRRPSNNIWYLLGSSRGFTAVTWGESGDYSAPADYDGDGKTDIAVFRPSTGVWYIIGTTRGFYTLTWGQAGDVPAAGDYDGDAMSDIAVFRPSNGTWYIIGSTAGFIVTAFGQQGDAAVPGVLN